ncbi:MAG: hypothetical protein ABR987_14605 [Terracidiphilus sp.]|jgi:hypothetical protein
MNDVALNPILERVFRSNPAYELVAFDRLPLDRQELFAELARDPDFYGLLLPRISGAHSIKSVCRETAQLVRTMIQPGPLPGHVLDKTRENTNQAIAELVLDAVLEVEHEGRFVSGPEAYPLIYAAHAAPAPAGLLPRLSQAALEYGQALAIDDPVRLSSRLYFYNRIPLTSSWTQRLPAEDAVSAFLGVSAPKNLKRLERNWSRVESPAAHQPWFQWRSRSNRPSDDQRRHGYKLYISPRPEELPAAFSAVVQALQDSSAHFFKVGRNAMGLLRPDKLVVYFRDFEPLEKTAHELALRLSGCAAHGVPFTAALGDDGLLSWGVDPLPEKGALSWQGPESWRLWVTNRLAIGLVSARNNIGGTLQPWKFALERLRLENVNTVTWAPRDGFGLPLA